MGDLRLRGKGSHSNITKMIRVTHNDVHQEVVGSCHVEEGDNLFKLLGVPAKSLDLCCLVAVQSNRNHRLQADAKDTGVNVGMKPSEHP